ncbi:MAG: 3'-5' exonuclease [Euryarchaeota archaeon]|jgi:DNA polymerase-3 subunit epsilon|nr:3'-5' exonuclease [Euryarchaeota archaeon]
MVGDLFANERVLAFDLETTGISTRTDKIVQYALIGSDACGAEISVEGLVNPGCLIPPRASEIHGIYNRDVMDAAQFVSHAQKMYDLMDGAIIVGHNVRRFDMPFLTTEFSRVGMLAPKPKAIIDTLEIVRKLKLPRPHNLGSLCNRHGVDLANAHTAGADAAATLLLLWRVMKDNPQPFRQPILEIERWATGQNISSDGSALGRGYDDLPPVDSAGRLRRDNENIILAFGRHRGKTIKQLINSDLQYYNWLISSASGINDEAIIELKAHVQ